MQGLQKLGSSILFAALSLFLVLGGLSTTLAEDRIDQPLPTITETPIPPSDTADLFTATLSAPGLLPSATISSSPSPTATIPPSTTCPAPNGWTSYIIQIGDTLEGLAARYGIFPNTLKEANCLIGNSLLPNTRISVPPTPTATLIPCGAPYGWIFYTVKAGDNLYRIGLAYRVSVGQLQNANCLGSSVRINVGQKLSVPNVPTSTPVATNTPMPTTTATPTATLSTPLSTLTATFTDTATATEISPLPTEPPTPTNTATEIPSPTFTFTPIP